MEQYLIVIILFILADVISISLAFYVIFFTKLPLTLSYSALLIGTFGWALTGTFTRLAETPEAAVFWSQCSYLFIGAVCVAWLNFALQYSGRFRLTTPLWIGIISLVPATTSALIFFNDFHHLIWRGLDFYRIGQYVNFRAHYGVWFWIQAIYCYGLLIAGFILIIIETIREKDLIFRQAFLLMFGSAFPLVINFLYISRLIPGFQIDVTPVGFTFGGVLIAMGLFRFRMLEILPVANHVVVQNIQSGVIVLGTRDIVLAVNPAAERMMQISMKRMLGKPLKDHFGIWNDYHDQFMRSEGKPIEVRATVGGEERFFDVSLTHLIGSRKRKFGNILVFNEITEHKKFEENLRLHRDHLQELVDEQTKNIQQANELLTVEVAEREQAQMQLQQERDLLTHLMDISPVGIVMVNEDFKMTFANLRAGEILGVSAATLLDTYNQVGDWSVCDLEGRKLDLKASILSNRDHLAFLKHRIVQIQLRPDAPQVIMDVTTVPIHQVDGGAGYLATFEDVTERIRTQQKLTFMATHDLLTGLDNRGSFNEKLYQAIEDADKDGGQLAVLFIDIDDFKSINDAFLHNRGDELLQIVARRLEESARPGDIVSRYSGDEFLVLLRNVKDQDEVTLIVKNTLARIADPVLIEGMEIIVTASVGVAMYPFADVTAEKIIQYADLAMYHAKKKGKRNFEFYDAEKASNSFKRLSMVSDLRRAIEKGELVLLYQPIVDIFEGRIKSVEALIRWNHPTLGLISPGYFIKLAEENGLMVELGDWVIHTACQQGKAWLKAGLPPIIMQVNVSEKQLTSHLIEQIQLALEASQFSPDCLEIELSEDVVFTRMMEVSHLLEEIRNLHVGIAIDDFGTSQTSVRQLAAPFFDALKIDRSIITTVDVDDKMQMVVSGLLKTAEALGLEVVAEGVETFSQLETLHDLGVRLIQGYYLFYPMPADQVSLLIPRSVTGILQRQ